MAKVTGIKEMFKRKLAKVLDMDYIQNNIYNDASAAQKNFNVEPVVKAVYTANDQVEFGSYVKVAAGTTSYDVACVGKAHSASSNYRLGDLVTQGGDVYLCTVAHQAQAFDAGNWRKVAPATISGIPTSGGAVVCVGKYHNSINVNGFLIEDDSTFSKSEQ